MREESESSVTPSHIFSYFLFAVSKQTQKGGNMEEVNDDVPAEEETPTAAEPVQDQSVDEPVLGQNTPRPSTQEVEDQKAAELQAEREEHNARRLSDDT